MPVLALQELASFLLSPEARDLRPLLVGWASGGLDLLLRDRLRKGYALLSANLTPRLPFIGERQQQRSGRVWGEGGGTVRGWEGQGRARPDGTALHCTALPEPCCAQQELMGAVSDWRGRP